MDAPEWESRGIMTYYFIDEKNGSNRNSGRSPGKAVKTFETLNWIIASEPTSIKRWIRWIAAKNKAWLEA